MFVSSLIQSAREQLFVIQKFARVLSGVASSFSLRSVYRSTFANDPSDPSA